ncbi:MAG: tandem-95 repeat protein, partial [Alphaproteobacteria bacterium]|nr:tandem-95 repeat protein [Alphaproteobacteria bacterium]
MADQSSKTNIANSGQQDPNDPILQGIDRVQSKEQIDSRLSSEAPIQTDDTHTKSNIHLGSGDDGGKASGPEDKVGGYENQSPQSPDLAARAYKIPDGGFIEGPGNQYVPETPPEQEITEYQSSGRATPQIELEDDQNASQPDQINGIGGSPLIQNAFVINPLFNEVNPDLPVDNGNQNENSPPTTSLIDLGATNEDNSVTFSDEDLLANASDPDDDPLTVGDVTIDPEYGEIIDNGDGTYTFVPSPDFNGDDLPITYTISDGTSTIPGSAIIDVLPVNDPPASADNDAVIEEDHIHTFSLDDFAFSDVDGDSFDHITIINLPVQGSLTFNGNPVTAGDEIAAADLGLLVFTPDADENGNDYATFDFTVNEGTDDSEQYTFSIDVTPVNDAPTSADGDAITNEDTLYTFQPADFTFDDIDGDSLDHITIVDLPANGTLYYDGNPVNPGDNIAAGNIGLLSFMPDADENGDNYATFNFTVNDGTEDSAQYTFSIDVTPVNDAPESADQDVVTNEDTAYVFSAGDFAFTDIDTATMDHITIVDLPANGTLYYDGNPVNPGDNIAAGNIGLLSFMPDADENGDNYASFNFTVNDGSLDS